jgi:fermentation-respiration switch protein FrsA (DUF1100 family)
MKKWLHRVVTAFVILIAAVYALALGNIWLNETTLIFPGADLDADTLLIVNDSISTPYNTVRVTTEDGIRILLLESLQTEKPQAPWVIYFYGQGGQVADRWSFRHYKLFRRVGLNLLAVEYRGYGASEKTEPTEAGVYADARAAWTHLIETRRIPASRIVFYGYSLGDGVAVQMATEMSPGGLITESTFTSIPEAIRAHYPWLPAGLVVQNRFENLEKARTLPLPWLIFHGRQDRMVPFEHAEALSGTTVGPRRLVPLRSGHENTLDFESDKIERALRKFVRELFGTEVGN